MPLSYWKVEGAKVEGAVDTERITFLYFCPLTIRYFLGMKKKLRWNQFSMIIIFPYFITIFDPSYLISQPPHPVFILGIGGSLYQHMFLYYYCYAMLYAMFLFLFTLLHIGLFYTNYVQQYLSCLFAIYIFRPICLVLSGLQCYSVML